MPPCGPGRILTVFNERDHMHAVINHLHLNKPVEEVRPGVEKELVPLLRTLSGFRAFYFVREAEDRAAVVILWDRAEDAQQGAAVIGPGWFHQNIAPHLASEQIRSTGDVIATGTP
jgi:heme-degrading monooxygenase HmoA